MRDDSSAKLGYVASVLAQNRRRAHMPLIVALRLLEVAIALDQIKIYFGIDGKQVAFISWALLSDDVEDRILRTKSIRLRNSEWNEGKAFRFVDFVSSD